MKYIYENAYEYENGFSLTAEIYRWGNMISHYELYKKIVGIPGDVIECGVFKGNSLIQFACYRELMENERSRKIVGFDAFGAFPVTPPHIEENFGDIKSDKEFVHRWNKEFAEEFLTKEDIYDSLAHKGIGNVELVEGDILETVDYYVKEHPAMRIALLHIDVDVYHPAKKALDTLYPLVVRGGVVVLDDYGTVEGETVAVEEFLEMQEGCVLQKFPFSHAKPSFFVKR